MGIGGIFGGGLGNIIAQTALASMTGGSSLLVSTIGRQLLSSVGQNIIQKLGQQIGIPQPMIDLAQAQFAGAMGDARGVASNMREAQQGIQDSLAELFQATNASPTQRGELERVIDQLLDNVTKEGREGAEEANKKGGKAGAESFFVAFAKALGKTMDSKMERMMEVAKKIDAETQKANSSNGKKQAVVGELSAELQGLSQELKLVSDAMNTSVKAMGQATQKAASAN